MQTFLGAGNTELARQFGAATCPSGTRAVGIRARSSCYALTQLQVSHNFMAAHLFSMYEYRRQQGVLSDEMKHLIAYNLI